MRSLSALAAPLGLALLAACADDAGDPAAPGGRLFVGYYAEDPATNPEDPTVGALMFTVPDGDGAFAGQMPFSYVGCSAGVDTGLVAGQRSGGALTGTWAGTMDEVVEVGGDFTATFDAARDGFTGTFTNADGKEEVARAPCRYFVAERGTFAVWGADAREPAGFVLSVDTTATPAVLRWTATSSGARYGVRLFSEACLLANARDPACFLGELITTELSAPVGVGAPLVPGTRYLAVVTAQAPVGGAFLGFASLRFAAPGAPGPSPSPTDPARPYGALTIDEAAQGTRFVPGGNGARDVALTDTGPNCQASGHCTSIRTVAWAEQDLVAGRSRSVGVVMVSSTMSPPGAAPGQAVTAVSVTYNETLPAPERAAYAAACGPTLSATCMDIDTLGVAHDAAARTVTFSRVALPGTAPTMGTVVLDGVLRY